MNKRRIRTLKALFRILKTTDGWPLPEGSWRAFKRAWVRKDNGHEPFVVPKEKG